MITAIAIARLAVGLLPASRAKNWLLSRTGWTVAPSAHIGPNIFLRVGAVDIADEARLGSFNLVRSLRRFEMSTGSVVGNLNSFAAPIDATHFNHAEEHRAFLLGPYAAVTSRHYFDCSGGVAVGEQTTIAGVRSTFMSHGPDLRESRMLAQSVRIGSQCFVGAGVTVTRGCKITDRVVVSAGSVVLQDLDRSESLYQGSPAVWTKDYSGAAYFARAGMRIDTRVRPV